MVSYWWIVAGFVSGTITGGCYVAAFLMARRMPEQLAKTCIVEIRKQHDLSAVARMFGP
jgi:hypothetical protein